MSTNPFNDAGESKSSKKLPVGYCTLTVAKVPFTIEIWSEATSNNGNRNSFNELCKNDPERAKSVLQQQILEGNFEIDIKGVAVKTDSDGIWD